jgi:hypothetical protein
MAEKKRQPPPFDRLLSVAAIIVSVIALFFSWQANRLLDEQNAIVRETNRLSVADIEVLEYWEERPIYFIPCTAPENFRGSVHPHWLLYGILENIVLSNNGGRPITLISAEMSPNLWQLQITEQGSQIDLPLTIDEGISKRLIFSAARWTEYSTVQERDIAFDINDVPSQHQLKLAFGTGEEIILEIGSSVWSYAVDPNDFGKSCTVFEQAINFKFDNYR